LDARGYSETSLASAWGDTTNQEMASKPWTKPQRDWLQQQFQREVWAA
jgi:hypothetical protein